MWQVAEAELLATAGWGWTDATITGIAGEANAEDGDTLTVTISHLSGDDEADIEKDAWRG